MKSLVIFVITFPAIIVYIFDIKVVLGFSCSPMSSDQLGAIRGYSFTCDNTSPRPSPPTYPYVVSRSRFPTSSSRVHFNALIVSNKSISSYD